MAYNNDMEHIQKIQVIRPINEQDKTIRKVLEQAKSFKVLTYPEAEKRLDEIVDYSLIDIKYKKGSI